MKRRRWIVPLLAVWAVVATALLLWSLLDRAGETGWPGWPWEVPATTEAPPIGEPPPELQLLPATFADLPGWGEDDLAGALAAFLRSCDALDRRPAERPLGGAASGLLAGKAGDWRGLCLAARDLPRGPGADRTPVRAFFEANFRPFQATDRGDGEGFFTGYFEPTLQGSRRPSERFSVPLYLQPPELVSVDLGRFRQDLAGRRIAGRVEDGRLVPFPDRRAIDDGALAGRGLELLWVDDPLDAFFLHIQGSGRVELAAEDGEARESLRVGYAAQNGHPYFAIGRELVERGVLTLEEVSLQSIRAWLEAHPGEAREVLHTNPSYVFFRHLSGEGPEGSLGVPLTPGRSLAVDRKFLPLGPPVWLDTTAPVAGEAAERPLRRLLLAQDTGGAIRGPVRGDVFWGPGDAAADIAGRMKHPGRLWILLPQSVRVPAEVAAPAAGP